MASKTTEIEAKMESKLDDLSVKMQSIEEIEITPPSIKIEVDDVQMPDLESMQESSEELRSSQSETSLDLPTKYDETLIHRPPFIVFGNPESKDFIANNNNSVMKVNPHVFYGCSLNQQLVITTSHLKSEHSNDLNDSQSPNSVRTESIENSREISHVESNGLNANQSPNSIRPETVENSHTTSNLKSGESNGLNASQSPNSIRTETVEYTHETSHVESRESNGLNANQLPNSIRTETVENRLKRSHAESGENNGLNASQSLTSRPTTILHAKLTEEKPLGPKMHRPTAPKKNAPNECNIMEWNEISENTDIFKIRHFELRPVHEQIRIKNLGRPTPPLAITQKDSMGPKGVRKRKFSPEYYNKFKWLCGSSEKNCLFCYPCVLFGGNDSWTKTGSRDIKNIARSCYMHEASKTHKLNCVKLGFLGGNIIPKSVDTTLVESTRKHNEEVTKNRHILSQIINCIQVCGQLEMPLGLHEESASTSPGIFRTLLDQLSQTDGFSKDHFEKSTLFKGRCLKTIQNEILDCILHVCQEKIVREISEANFLAVIVDDNTDSPERAQMSVIYRYEVGGWPVERFWNFKNAPGDDAVSLYASIDQELAKVLPENPGKLIAQTYDGAAAIEGRGGGVHKLINKKCPNAHFVHNYAHELDLILQQASQTTREARVFFSGFSGIPEFFSGSPEKISRLEAVPGNWGDRRIPPDVRWTVNFVKENLESLRKCFEILSDSPTLTTRRDALGLHRLLNDSEFLHWLNFFSLIMPHVEVLCDQLHAKTTDSLRVAKALKHFLEHIVRTITDGIGNDNSGVQSSSQGKGEAEREICRTIVMQVSKRFEFTSYLEANHLISKENFRKFHIDFPIQKLKKTVEAYPILKSSSSSLRTELEVLYSLDELHTFRSPCELLRVLKENEQFSTLGEVIKLLQIVITTPMMSSEGERTFSTLKRVKAFLKNTTAEEGLTALAMLSCEREMIASIPGFKDLVMKRFSAVKDYGIHLTFK